MATLSLEENVISADPTKIDEDDEYVKIDLVNFDANDREITTDLGIIGDSIQNSSATSEEEF